MRTYIKFVVSSVAMQQFCLSVAYKVIRGISLNTEIWMTKRHDFGLQNQNLRVVSSAITRGLRMTKSNLSFHFVCQNELVTDYELIPSRHTK
jgi:hypothetical protein